MIKKYALLIFLFLSLNLNARNVHLGLGLSIGYQDGFRRNGDYSSQGILDFRLLPVIFEINLFKNSYLGFQFFSMETILSLIYDKFYGGENYVFLKFEKISSRAKFLFFDSGILYRREVDYHVIGIPFRIGLMFPKNGNGLIINEIKLRITPELDFHQFVVKNGKKIGISFQILLEYSFLFSINR